MRTQTRISLLAATTALLLCGCTRAINRSAERRIRDALPDLLGSARDYRVHVENDPMRTVTGHLSRVRVDGDEVQMKNGLLIDSLHLMLTGVEVDTRRRIVTGVRSARFSADFGEAAVDEYMAGEMAQQGSIRHPRVHFRANNLVTLTAERTALGIGIPFTITGPVSVASPTRIGLDPRHMTVVGLPLAGAPLRVLTSHFEHGLDLSSLPLPVSISSVNTTPGRLTLSGTADAGAILRAARQAQH